MSVKLCLAQSMAMSLAVVRSWGEQAVSIMGQTRATWDSRIISHIGVWMTREATGKEVEDGQITSSTSNFSFYSLLD